MRIFSSLPGFFLFLLRIFSFLLRIFSSLPRFFPSLLGIFPSLPRFFLSLLCFFGGFPEFMLFSPYAFWICSMNLQKERFAESRKPSEDDIISHPAAVVHLLPSADHPLSHNFIPRGVLRSCPKINRPFTGLFSAVLQPENVYIPRFVLFIFGQLLTVERQLKCIRCIPCIGEIQNIHVTLRKIECNLLYHF